MKKNEKNGWKSVNFGAGRAFDAFGRATSFWTGAVAYKWDCSKQVFRLHSEQELGTGTAANSSSYNEEVKTCDEVNDFLDYFKELETHFKKVYGE